MHFIQKTGIILATVSALGLVIVGPALALSYTYKTLDVPGATSGTNAYGINDAGQVVGYYHSATGNHGFLETPGAATPFMTLDDPASKSGALNYGTDIYGINNMGQVVGSYANATGNHGFLETPGTGFTSLDYQSSPYNTQVTGINDAGKATGYYFGNGTGSFNFFYTPGTGFTALNPPAGTSGTSALGINNSGQVVGYYDDSTGVHGFLDTPGTGFVPIDDPLGGSVATGLNNSGQIVGYYYNNTGASVPHGFVETLGSGGAPSSFSTLDAPGGIGTTYAHGINDLGQVVGDYTDSAGVYHGFLATPIASAVPEVSSIASFGVLLLMGAISILVAARRRIQRAESAT